MTLVLPEDKGHKKGQASPSNCVRRQREKGFLFCVNMFKSRKNTPSLSLHLVKRTDESEPVELDTYPHGPCLILPGLYLGSELCAQDTGRLEKLGITVIVNLASELCPRVPRTDSGVCMPGDDGLTRYWFPWTHGQDDLASVVQPCLSVLQTHLAQGQSVLVHCQQGVSRSAILCMAYVMAKTRASFREAHAHVKSRSPVVSPNMVLSSQLCLLEEALHAMCI